MIEETLQETADRLKNFKGNVKGEVFRVHAEYIRQREGKEGVKRVEEKMKELGVSIVFDKVKSFEWIPEGKSSLTIIVAKEIFKWSDEDIFEMGKFAPKFSFIIKIIIQYLVSMESLLQNAEKHWGKHFDFGKIETEFFPQKNKAIVKEKDISPLHPLICIYHRGYYTGLCEFAVKEKNVNVTETKCKYNGDEYDEYLIEWN